MAACEIVADSGDRAAWLEARRGLVTASDVSAILGADPYTSRLELWQEKAGLAEGDDVESEAAEWGIPLEGAILEMYRRRTGREAAAYQKLCRSTEYPWLGATCDAWTVLDGVGKAPLELKSSLGRRSADWEEEVPAYYLPQIETQMIVMGSDVASVACLTVGPRLRWADVRSDRELRERIIDETRDFMRRVEQNDPPPPDGSESAKRALERRYAKERPGAIVELGQPGLELDIRLSGLGRQIKELEKAQSEAKNRLREMIGENECGALPGGGRWVWATERRKRHVVKASKVRVLRRKK